MTIVAFLAIFVTTALCSCDRQESVKVSLKVGVASKDYAVGADWATAQDELISAVRPLWDGLASGTSQDFQLLRTLPLPLDPALEAKLRAKDGDHATITSSETRSTPRFRFFRNRDGLSGIEQVDDNGLLPMVSGQSVDWSFMKSYMREAVFDDQRIRLLIGEQDARGNGR